MKRISVALGILAIALLGAFVILAPSATAPKQTFGATNTSQLIGGFPYFLAGSGISSSGTSITLTSLTLPQTGYKVLTTDLGNPFYVTIEPGSTSRQEFASCTTVVQNANNTATLSGCVRGLLPISPYTANSQYAFSHSGGTTLIFSNSPQFYQQFYALGNMGTSTNSLVFSSTTPPHYDSVAAQGSGTYISTTSELASVAYVNAIAIAGAANATAAVKGIVQLATAFQAASSTAIGSTGAFLVLPGSLATDTPGIGTSGGRVVMSDLLGNVWKGVLANLGLANTFTATTTFTAAVIPAEVNLATTTSMTVNFGNGSRQLIRKGSASMTVAFQNYVAGESLALTICNPTTGSGGALTFSGVMWPGSTAPVLTTTTSTCDIVTLNATNATSTLQLFGGFNLNYP